MYSMKDLLSWWEVPAIAHFFSLFKSCFSLTDFTIEELEEALLSDGESDVSTAFTSKLLMELLQGCYNNANISVTNYHETLIDIMKRRWELEDGRVNPLASIHSDFHGLPTQLKVQIIHRLTEYRLDAQDVEEKLCGLNPSDLRLEPLGSDRNGSKYWYFFGVRLYKETPPETKSRKRKKRRESSPSGKRSKSSDPFWGFPTKHSVGKKKHKKRGWKKRKKEMEEENDSMHFGGMSDRLSDSKWEVVCYNVGDWKKLAKQMEDGISEKEEALHQLITKNFLPNLPKIVEDMEYQKLQKFQAEPRRSSCRLLAKKLYQEDESIDVKREALDIVRRKQEDERLEIGFQKMLQVELDRRKREAFSLWKKDQEEQRRKRLEDGLQPDEDSSSGNESDEEVVIPPRSGSKKKSSRGAEVKESKTTSTKKSKSLQSNNHKNGIPASKSSDEALSANEYSIMLKTWEVIDNNPEAWPFQTPVEESYAPGYHSIIKRPMDLSTIEEKIKKCSYKAMKEFKEDITLMFNNCRLYNGPDSEYTDVANQLDSLFQKTLSKNLGQKPVKQTPVKQVPDQKPAAPRKKSPSPELLQDGEDEEADEEEDRSDPQSSSDEFTPSWVSKAQAKKMRLASKERVKESKRKPSIGRGRSLSRNSAKEKTNSAVAKPKSGRYQKKRGPKRGRKPSVLKSSKLDKDLSDVDSCTKSESDNSGDNEDVTSPREANKTDVKEAPARGRGRYKRASKNKPKPKNNDSLSPEPHSVPNINTKSPTHEPEANGIAESESKTDIDDTVKTKTADGQKFNKNSKTNKNRSSSREKTANPVDGDSSSSSSRGSSRSQSLEKFEKLEEDAKSKPQVMWSLDYLASQARVLEEQYKTESNSTNSRQTANNHSDVTKKTDNRFSNFMKENPDLVRANRQHLGGEKRPGQFLSPQNSSNKLAKRKIKDEVDVYSFKDVESPDNKFSRKNEHVKSENSESSIRSSTSVSNTKSKNNDSVSAPQVSEATRISVSSPQSSTSQAGKKNVPSYVQSNYYSNQLAEPASTSYSAMTMTATAPSCKAVNSYTTTLPQPVPSTGYSQHIAGVTPHNTTSGNRDAQQPPRVMQEDKTRATNEQDNAYMARKLSQDVYQDAKTSSPATSQYHQRQSIPATIATENKVSSSVSTSASHTPVERPTNTTTSMNMTNQPTMPFKQGANQTLEPSMLNRRHSLPNYSQAENSLPTKSYMNQVSELSISQSDKSSYSYPNPAHYSTNITPSVSSINASNNNPKTYPNPAQAGSRPSHDPQPAKHTHHNLPNPSPDTSGRLQKPASKPDPPHERLQYEQSNTGMHRPTNYQEQQNYAYPLDKQSGADRSASAYYRNSASHYQEENHAVAAAMLFQNPTMANLGLPPWSLSQPPTTHSRPSPQHSTPTTTSNTKSSSMSGYIPLNYHAGSQPHESGNHRQPHHSSHNPPPSMPPTSLPQSQRQSNNGHRMSNKSRHHSTTSDTSGTTAANSAKYSQRPVNSARTSTAHTNINQCPPSSGQGPSGSNANRQSTSANDHFQHKNYGDYRGYRIPPTPAPTPLTRESTGYSPQQHNGLLSASGGPNNNTSLLHQDLTASATLRALQQQHKSDRPSSHAAASMLHYAAAVQQSQGAVAAAANEQYNRLAASAHHRSNPQHAHPLAGVYHSHHNPATSNAHQAAAHLGTPWLQATASPGPGYPSNLLHHPHIDPVYHLMQQSSMHGQYPMYSNHVMQQLHQQHLQRHMLPKY